jgi:hypothetical protein
MKTLLLCLMFAATTATQADDLTALVATEAAVVSIEKASQSQPAPTPDPDGAAIGKQTVTGPLDIFRDGKALIDKGNALADRGKAILDQAQRDGKITVDIRLPMPPAGTPQTHLLDFQKGESTSRVNHTRGGASSSTELKLGGSCPGGVCPLIPPEKQKSPVESAMECDATTSCSNCVSNPRRLLRWRR